MVFKEYNENAGGSRDPMRAVQTRRFLYLFNPWSNGKRIMATATTGTPTYRRMAELAKTNKTIAARHDLYQHRVPEELYDIEADPDCLVNLIDAPDQHEELVKLQAALEAWMVKTNDHILNVFRKRNEPAVREAYVLQKEKEAEQRKKRKKGKKKNKQASKSRPKRLSGLIAFEQPKSITAGNPLVIKIRHKLPADLGSQLLHVTLKGGPDAKRVKRKVVKVSGHAVTEVTFDVPATVPGNTVRFAAFLGKDFASNLQHIQTANLPVR